MTQVKFGWRLPAFPLDNSRRDEFITQIKNTLQIISGKFDSFWIADHFVPWADFVGDDTDVLECWTSLCYFAAAFPGFDIGSIVLSQSYRNPAYLAKAAATLQLLSGGRFILGLGAGWKEDEYRAYNYPFPSASTRIKQLEEAVQIVRKMWTESPASFEGKYYTIQDAYCEPRPQPEPPILIGGGGEQLTLRVVARWADWWNIGGPLDFYARKQEILRSYCDAVGRDYGEILQTWGGEGIIIAENETDARKIATTAPFGNSLGEAIVTPDRVAEHLQQYIDLGVRYFILRFADFPGTRGIELFAESVIPQLRRA